MVVKTKINNVVEDWTACEIRDMNGRFMYAPRTEEAASLFLKGHFKCYFPCDVRVEFNGLVAYIFQNK